MRNLRDEARWIIGEIDEAKRLAKAIGKPQLGTSSIEAGRVEEYDQDGALVQIIGEQYDGTHAPVTVNGPTPPEPAGLSLTVGVGSVEARWNGRFVGDAVSPMDFSHVSLHGSRPEVFTPSNETQLATIAGELGDVATVILEPGEWTFGLVAVSKAGKWSELSETVTVEIPDYPTAGELQDELIGLGTAVDGKITVEIRPPAVEDGDGKPVDALWNELDPISREQVAVWRWTGEAWEEMPLSELAVPKINIAEGTYGRLRGVQLEADAVDGMVITGAVIQSPRGGAGYQLTENGYTSRDVAGNVTVRLPADGTPAQFRGDVEARSLTASGRVSMQAQGNEIASGAELILEAGVTPPLTPPTVGNSYTSIELPRLGSIDGRNMNGLARAANLWWRASHDAGLMLHGIDSTGAIVRTISTGMAGSNGLTAIGNELFVLGRWTGDSAPRSVAVYDATTGAYLRRWDYAQYGSGTYQPGIGTNGTDLYIVQSDANGKVIWRSFNKTNGAVISVVDTGHNIKSDMAGIYRGTADFGVDRVAVTRVNGTTEVFTPAGTNQPYEGWYSADGNAAQGLVWHDGKFWQLQYDTLVAYSNIAAPSGAGVGDTDDWWVAATWKGANGAETTVGPPQRFTFLRRAELQITAGTLPAGSTGVAFYLAKKITSPSRTDLHLLASVNGPNARITTLPSNWAGQPSPPSSNTFNNASPGTIRSRAENFKVDGAGAGRWGPLTFHADGTMTSAAVPEWVPITSFLNGCTVGDFGFVPAYRSWPDGKVELRGVVKGNLDVIKTVFSLPSAVRPTRPVNLVAATSGGGTSTGVMRVEFGSLATPDAMSVVPQGARRLWVSLDGLYYYQS